jgi:4-amino-4-deoxy-L-arabinose transferase-like glycosyltransferase
MQILMDWLSRHKDASRYIVFLAVLSAIVVGIAGSNPYLPGGGDNAAYIAEAESLLANGKRLQLYAPGTPPETLKPPLFSVLLAVVEAAFGRNVLAMKVLLAVAAGLAVLFAAWVLRIGTKEDVSVEFLVFWIALTPSLTLYTHDILADVPYTALVLLAVALAGRAARNGASNLWLVVLAIVLILANLLRTAGMLVCLACGGFFLVEAILRRHEPHFRRLVAGVILIAVVGVISYQFVSKGPQGYLSSATFTRSTGSSSDAETSVQRIQRVASSYALLLPAEIAGYEGFGPVAATPLLIVLGLIPAGLGAAQMWQRGQRLIPIAFILLQAPLLLFPFIEARYYLPSLVFFICLFWAGCVKILKWADAKGVLPLTATAFLIALAPAVSIVGTLRAAGDDLVETASGLEWGIAITALLIVIAFVCMKRASKAPTVLTCVAAIFLLCAGSRSICENVIRERHHTAAPAGTGWPEFYEAAQTVKAHAGKKQVVISAKPSLVWFWTGMQGLSASNRLSKEFNAKQLAQSQWVILDELVEDRAIDCLKPLLAAELEQWEVVYRKGETVALRRRK